MIGSVITGNALTTTTEQREKHDCREATAATEKIRFPAVSDFGPENEKRVLTRIIVGVFILFQLTSSGFASPVYSDSNDNHFPMFPNCSSYKPVVKEDQPIGTHVINVKAVDEDPPGRGGTLTYSLVAGPQDSVTFHIDGRTGVVTTKYSYTESIPQDLQPGAQVMRIMATDIDDGPNQEIVYSLRKNTDSEKGKFLFSINEKTGIVTLIKTLEEKQPGYTFKMKAFATDASPNEPRTSKVDLVINVVEPTKKAPYFVGSPPHEIHLKENFMDRSQDIATFEAKSKTNEPAPTFRLVTGKSEQTNKEDTFALSTRGNEAFLRLASPSLDYEKVKEYTLTVRIENTYGLATEHTIIVKIDDVNDEPPRFIQGIDQGSVLEDEPIGTPVMQVSAIDLDETPAFRRITYELADNFDKFQIDPNTGNITTVVKFDREYKDSYNLKVIAKDGAPSAILNNGEPNSREHVFRIKIEDKNDHSPKFKEKVYTCEILENSDKDSVVTKVHADDVDSASTIRYSITNGNVDDAFYVEAETGRIKIKNPLDFEKITNYTLTLIADDGLYRDSCAVIIDVSNVNDNAPVFYPYKKIVAINEEELVPGCIIKVQAYDPDIRDRNATQDIVYSLVKSKQQKWLSINNDGCLSLIKPLDRDKPNGTDLFPVIIKTNDEGGPSKQKSSLSSTAEVIIILKDKNDNAPFLNMKAQVVWRENQNPGLITELTADDYDGPGNGKPFKFELAAEAGSDIRMKFSIVGENLEATTSFDREEQKEYRIPIWITDYGDVPMTGVSYLTVIIGDDNDNPMMDESSSSIFVHYLQGDSTPLEIGRVFVNDPDDWDLPDKIFTWEKYNTESDKYFILDRNSGMITMEKAPSSSYVLHFKVTENFKSTNHTVSAIVNVTVKEIREEAVYKSGSIRFENITPEEFITRNRDGKSKADLLKSQLALALNKSEDNIDVFTISASPIHKNPFLLDVRFSAYGPSYYPAEELNAAIIRNQKEIENVLGAKMLMVNVDECLIEKENCESSCTNQLTWSNMPVQVFTNTTSFIGIQAYVEPKCHCKVEETTCSNGGSLTSDGRCLRTKSLEGLSSESSSIGFTGSGWALYPTFSAVCEDTRITVYVRSEKADGLVFYAGPETILPSSLGVQDFIALELRKGYLVLWVDYGTGTAKIEHNHKKVDDSNFHRVDIILSPTSIELIVDDCKLQKCSSITPPIGSNKYLNVNGPLQVGGTYMDLAQVSDHRRWLHKPKPIGFTGCIENFAFNGKLYNLSDPILSQSVNDCSTSS